MTSVLAEKYCSALHRYFLVNYVEGFSKEARSIFLWVSTAPLQTELIDLQENLALREVSCDAVTFWTKIATAANFPNLQKAAIFVTIMFGSTRICILSTECRKKLVPELLDK